MKKLYTLPKMDVIAASQGDILTYSVIADTLNRENVVRDPFAPKSAQVTFGNQEA